MSTVKTGYTALYNSVTTDLIDIFDTSAPGNLTTGILTSATGYNNKDLGKIFTPYVTGTKIDTGFITSTGKDLGSLFNIGPPIKYTVTGTYVTTSYTDYSDVIIFTGNGTINLTSLPKSNNVLLVGGGGAPWALNRYTGGGGGGGVGVGPLTIGTNASNSIIIGKSYSIIIGNGGISNSVVYPLLCVGGNSQIIDSDSKIPIATAYGGGRGGGGPSTYIDGSPGGSGGGGGSNTGYGTGGAATKGTGGGLTYYGNKGGSCFNNNRYGCGGGGAGSAGVDYTVARSSGTPGGAGYQFINGNTYGAGGSGYSVTQFVQNSGNGGTVNDVTYGFTYGANGICIICLNY